MLEISRYISNADKFGLADYLPWELTENCPEVVEKLMQGLGEDFSIANGIAIHNSAIIEAGVTLKPPLIIEAGCFVAAHAYLRGGVLLFPNVTIGPSVEVKSSVIFSDTSLAHFNFVGDSVIGSGVNIEAGAIFANFHNDREDKTIRMCLAEQVVELPVRKFGSLIGDRAKIGANSVLNPGTVLSPNQIVGRLVHVNQELKHA